MAKPPRKRRGIQLGARAESAPTLDLLSAEPAASENLKSDTVPSDVDADGSESRIGPAMLTEQLAQLRRMNADLEDRLRCQAEQLRQMEQHGEQIASQERQLQALVQARRASSRLGFLLGLLVISGVGAVGFHAWPRIQDAAGDWNRVTHGVAELAPQLQAVRGQVSSLTSDMGQMGSAVATLRKDVSDMRSDRGSVRRAADTVSESKSTANADAGAKRSAAYGLPHNAMTMANPYRRVMRPMMRW